MYKRFEFVWSLVIAFVLKPLCIEPPCQSSPVSIPYRLCAWINLKDMEWYWIWLRKSSWTPQPMFLTFKRNIQLNHESNRDPSNPAHFLRVNSKLEVLGAPLKTAGFSGGRGWPQTLTASKGGCYAPATPCTLFIFPGSRQFICGKPQRCSTLAHR